MIEPWSIWLYTAAWLPYLACLILYGLRSPWQSSATGRAQFTLYAALVTVLSFVILVQVVDLPDWLRDFLRITVVGSVAIAGILQLRNICTVQRQARDCPHPLRRATDHPANCTRNRTDREDQP